LKLNLEDRILRQISKFIEDWVPNEASIAVAGGDRYISYIPGNHDIKIKQGQPIPSGSISERVYLHQQRVEALVDKSVFGKPYYGIGYPLEDRTTGLKGALTVILPPDFSIRRAQTVSYLAGRRDEIWTPIPIEQIIYIESFQKKTIFYTENGLYSAKYPLKTLEHRLPDSFMRIHRSFIVNIAYIEHISRDYSSNFQVKLKALEDKNLVISQTYIQQVRMILGF
jgi:two-component system, LytTR family, response regulator LytT